MIFNSDSEDKISNLILSDRSIRNDILHSCIEDYIRFAIYTGAICEVKNDAILGDEGDDVISGTEKRDSIYGGKGNDNISGGKGDDKIYGGEGNDVINGNEGNDYILGGEGDDSIYGDEGDDVIRGHQGNDHILGGNGDDRIYGNEGDDVIFGDQGNDVIDGGAGDDILIGDIGSDNLSGGSGNDVFVYSNIDDSMFDSPDKIIDFETGRDKIDISALKLINGEIIEIKQVNQFSYPKNEMIVHYNQAENLTSLMLDHNGNGEADFLIEIIGEINPIVDIVT